MTTYPPFIDFTLYVAPDRRIFTDINDNQHIEHIIDYYFNAVFIGQWGYQLAHYPSYPNASFITGCGGTYRTRQELEEDIPKYRALLSNQGFMINIRDTLDEVVIEGRPTINQLNACIGIYMTYLDNLPHPPSFIDIWSGKLNTVLSKLKKLLYRRISFIPYHTDKDNICSICYANEEDFVQLSCHHIFHRKCIETWVDRQRTCPLCRRRV